MQEEKDIYEILRSLGPSGYEKIKHRSEDLWMLQIDPTNDLLARGAFFLSKYKHLADEDSDVAKSIDRALKAYLFSYEALSRLSDALIDLDIYMDEYLGNGPIIIRSPSKEKKIKDQT